MNPEIKPKSKCCAKRICSHVVVDGFRSGSVIAVVGRSSFPAGLVMSAADMFGNEDCVFRKRRRSLAVLAPLRRGTCFVLPRDICSCVEGLTRLRRFLIQNSSGNFACRRPLKDTYST